MTAMPTLHAAHTANVERYGPRAYASGQANAKHAPSKPQRSPMRWRASRSDSRSCSATTHKKRAECDHDRIERGIRRTIEHTDKAREFTRRADNIQAAVEHAIYSDDPDAIVRLTERIAALECERATIKAYNAACRKGIADPATLPDTLARELADAIKAWGDIQCPGGRFPSYTLSNLSANIKRNRQRLEQLHEKGAHSDNSQRAPRPDLCCTSASTANELD